MQVAFVHQDIAGHHSSGGADLLAEQEGGDWGGLGRVAALIASGVSLAQAG